MNPHILIQDEKQIEALKSLRRIDSNGYLYYMEDNYDYYPLAKSISQILDAGCSTFVSRTPENDWLMYRNYDYRHKQNNDKHNPYTALNVIVKVQNPNVKYKSIGVADAFWLDSKGGKLVKGVCDDGKTDLSAFVMLPFLTVDGLNEKGLTVSIMALAMENDWKPIDYDTYQEKLNKEKVNIALEKANEEPDIWDMKASMGSIAYNDIDKKAWICEKHIPGTNMPNKKSVLHTVLMRMMLDNCADVKEALELADSVNVQGTMPGSDLHIMIGDASGNCKVLEWVDNKMNVVDSYHSTNFRFSADDVFHGQCPRDDVLKAGLKRGEKNGLRQDYGELTMRLASQNPEAFGEGSVTQYSCIYNMNKKTLKIYSYGNYTDSYHFSL